MGAGARLAAHVSSCWEVPGPILGGGCWIKPHFWLLGCDGASGFLTRLNGVMVGWCCAHGVVGAACFCHHILAAKSPLFVVLSSGLYLLMAPLA